MKKQLSILSIFIGCLISFSSCNKNLKDDLADVQRRIDSLDKINADLRKKLAEWGKLTGSNEPIIFNTTFEDNNGGKRQIKGMYNLKGNAGSFNAMRSTEDGKIYVKISRVGNSEVLEQIELAFFYDPESKSVSNIGCAHYWNDFDPYRNRIYYNPYLVDNGLTQELKIQKFDLQTGEIVLSYVAHADGYYTGAAGMSEYVPNPGRPVSTEFSFSGKLEKLSPYRT